jgi:hypothetical protein
MFQNSRFFEIAIFIWHLEAFFGSPLVILVANGEIRVQGGWYNWQGTGSAPDQGARARTRKDDRNYPSLRLDDCNA